MAPTATVTAASLVRTAPVLLTRDPDVVDALQGVPGLPFTVLAATPLQASAHWLDAPAAIISVDQVAAALAADLPARNVIVIEHDRPADLGAVRDLVTDAGGARYRADVVRLDLVATVLPLLAGITATL